MEDNQNPRTAIVTGGSGGIGSEVCRRLAADGFNVVVHYGSSRAKAEAVVAEIEQAGGKAVALAADISEESQIKQLFVDANRRYGNVHTVVANAGAMMSCPIQDVSLDDFQALMQVNLQGSFLTLREAARRLENSGRIIFVSSQLAERPRAGTGVYSASKAAIDGMLLSMSKELGDRGITVNSVRPGATSPGVFDVSDEARKKMFQQLSAFNRIGTPEDIAGVVSFLASEDAKWMTGQHLRADGGMSN